MRELTSDLKSLLSKAHGQKQSEPKAAQHVVHALTDLPRGHTIAQKGTIVLMDA
jgi:hypothetical protein